MWQACIEWNTKVKESYNKCKTFPLRLLSLILLTSTCKKNKYGKLSNAFVYLYTHSPSK